MVTFEGRGRPQVFFCCECEQPVTGPLWRCLGINLRLGADDEPLVACHDYALLWEGNWWLAYCPTCWATESSGPSEAGGDEAGPHAGSDSEGPVTGASSSGAAHQEPDSS